MQDGENDHETRGQDSAAEHPSDSKENAMHITQKTLLITGANRGVGRALVEEALERGVTRI